MNRKHSIQWKKSICRIIIIWKKKTSYNLTIIERKKRRNITKERIKSGKKFPNVELLFFYFVKPSFFEYIGIEIDRQRKSFSYSLCLCLPDSLFFFFFHFRISDLYDYFINIISFFVRWKQKKWTKNYI